MYNILISNDGINKRNSWVLGSKHSRFGVVLQQLCDSSRMIVVANSDFLNNDQLTQANADFAMSSLNWLLSRDELIGITPKLNQSFTLNLTDTQLSSLAWIVLGLIPGAIAAVGVAGWLKRRS